MPTMRLFARSDRRLGLNSILCLMMAAIVSMPQNISGAEGQERRRNLLSFSTAGASSRCPLTFKDVSASAYDSTDPTWDEYFRLKFPSGYEFSPAFADIDGDGWLDVLHVPHTVADWKTTVEKAWTVGLSRPAVVPDSSSDGNRQWFYQPPGSVINRTDADSFARIDSHGHVLADLDGDGVLDLLVMTGGGKGDSDRKPYDVLHPPLLFWGTPANNTAGLTLVGGTEAAEAANFPCRFCRGRSSYLLDFNGDGLLDVFTNGKPRYDNINAPGLLKLNNGDRTFRDTEVREFGTASLLTDVDGDGHAQELVIGRELCLPMRSGPKTDPRYPSYGPYQQDVKDFCRARKAGVLAVFKWNTATGTVDELSTPKRRRGRKQQQSIYRAGTMLRSIASGDFDDDHLADLVAITDKEIRFFYSSDRETGELPINRRGLASKVVDIPESCRPLSLKVVDIDLSGSQQLVIMCTSEVHVYRQKAKRVWVRSPCNGHALGDVARFTHSVPMLRKLSYTNCKTTDGRGMLHWCQFRYKLKNHPPAPFMATMSFLDLNRDGFPDIAMGDRSGPFYIYHNKPSDSIRNNRFVAVKLIGTTSNEPGIGSTLILTASGMGTNGTAEVSLLREVSYGSYSDPYGYQDDQTVFGLGRTGMPVRLEVRWPNRQVQMVDLQYLNTPEGAEQLSNAVSPIVITQNIE